MGSKLKSRTSTFGSWHRTSVRWKDQAFLELQIKSKTGRK